MSPSIFCIIIMWQESNQTVATTTGGGESLGGWLKRKKKYVDCSRHMTTYATFLDCFGAHTQGYRLSTCVDCNIIEIKRVLWNR